MDNYIQKDNDIVEQYRKENKLPRSLNFENGRITPSDIEKLIPIIAIPFDDEIIDYNKEQGFSSKGIHYLIQLNRLQQVFGHTHVKIETANKEQMQISTDGYGSKMDVTIKIGNYRDYIDSNNKPNSNFVPLYIVEGIGWGTGNNLGTSEKNAMANGIKDALSKMGMLRYLYCSEESLEIDGKLFDTSEMRTIELLDMPIFSKGAIYMKVNAKDTETDEEVEAIIYRVNEMNGEHHKNMINLIESKRPILKKGSVLEIECKTGSYSGRKQYIILNVNRKNSRI